MGLNMVGNQKNKTKKNKKKQKNSLYIYKLWEVTGAKCLIQKL